MENIKLPHDHNHSIERKFDHMPQLYEFGVISDTFKLLGDSTRVRLFWLLCHCEECVLNLSVMMDMSSPALSHHLKLLKTCGLVESRRDGKEMYYKAAETELTEALHNMIEKIMMISCPHDNDREENSEHSVMSEWQTAAIRRVHTFLTSDLSSRYTIEDLSRRFALNTSSLKQGFKEIYGQPIAAYMKEYRIRKAMELLRTTDKSIADIAAELGYRSQSRFAEAFRNVTGSLPTDYRKTI